MSKIGCIYTVAFRYYDLKTNSMKTKQRPFLIIKEEDSNPPIDLTVLPISTISRKNRINIYYDIKIENIKYPNLNLTKDTSYIRTNKIQTINEKDLLKKVSNNCKDLYPDLYQEIRNKVSSFYTDVL